jgi:FtsZ-interacting cell division protein YlmF
MKNPTLFMLCMLLFAAPLSAQYDDLLNNKNIVWIGEYNTDFGLQALECWSGMSSPAPFWYSHTDIKFNNQNQKEGYYAASMPACLWIYDNILKDITDNRQECYADEQLRSRLDADEVRSRLSKLDTVVTFNPENYEERVQIISNDINVEDIIGLRARVVYFYDNQKHSFGTRLLAYAPLVRILKEYNWEGEYAPLIWVKASTPPVKKLQKTLASKDVNWAVEVKPQMKIPRFDEFKTMKRKMDLPDIVYNEIKKPGKTCYDYEMKALSLNDIEKSIVRSDTVVTFDPETYEEKMRIVNYDGTDKIQSLNFIYVWYYDTKRRQLAMQTTFSIPLMSVVDDQGNFRFLRPVFYQKID